MQRVLGLFSGNALQARALRGAALTLLSFGGANVLRLAGNLILTRLLFPEAFGLMALVQVFVVGLQMFSDIGIQTSVIRSPRGSDPTFLNTAWTVQVLRGGLLWLGCLAIAGPAAAFYDQEMLRDLLPVAGVSVLILGFVSINMAVANRDLMLGRLTALELTAQILGLVAMIAAALIWQSVWALVVGGLVDAVAKLVLSHLFLPGRRVRFAMERPALLELFHFGKWIFLSTIAGFLMQHGDRMILGRYISLADLAFYNIGFFLATVPEMLAWALTGRILFPLYCNKPPAESAENRAKILRARTLLTGGAFALSLPLIFLGDEIVEVLYEPRYHSAGPILVAICMAKLLSITTSAYGSVLLAAGASRPFAGMMITYSILRAGIMLVGAMSFGIPGVVLSMVLAELLIYPVMVWLVRPYQAWEWRHDLGFLGLALAVGALAIWQDPAVWASFLEMAVRLSDP